MLFGETLRTHMPFSFLEVFDLGIRVTKYQNIIILTNILAMICDIGNICMRCTYVYTNKWSRSCSEQCMLQGNAPPRPLQMKF